MGGSGVVATVEYEVAPGSYVFSLEESTEKSIRNKFSLFLFFFFYLLYFYPSQNVIYEVINTEQAYMDDLSTTLEVSSWLKLLFIL